MKAGQNFLTQYEKSMARFDRIHHINIGMNNTVIRALEQVSKHSALAYSQSNLSNSIRLFCEEINRYDKLMKRYNYLDNILSASSRTMRDYFSCIGVSLHLTRTYICDKIISWVFKKKQFVRVISNTSPKD